MFGRGEVASLRGALEIELGYLADEVVALQGSDSDDDYRAAVDMYEKLGDALPSTDELDAFVPLCRALANARYLMARCRARVERMPRPTTDTPCFFDPGHGPASQFVAWTPVGKDPRTIPVCDADARAVEAGDQPDPRLVSDGKRVVAFWDAPDEYAYWFQGYYGSGDDCVPARMLEGFPLAQLFAESSTIDDGVITSDELFRRLPG